MQITIPINLFQYMYCDSCSYFCFWQHFGKSYQLKEASDVVKKAQGSTRESSTRQSKVVTTEMAKEPEEKQMVTRLESAEGMRKFFQSVTPSTQPNEPDTPKHFFNLDLPSNKDYVNEYLASRFFQAGEMSGFGRPSTLDTPSNRAYMNDQVPSERTAAMERFINSPSLYDGPDVEVRQLVLNWILFVLGNVNLFCYITEIFSFMLIRMEIWIFCKTKVIMNCQNWYI